MSDFDYTDFQEESDSDDALGQLSRLAHLSKQQEAEVLRCKKLLQEAENELKKTIEVDIPDLMEENNIDEFKSGDLVITVKESVKARISQEHTAAAHQWLEDNGLAAIIKDNFTLAFGKGEQEESQQLAQELDKMGLSYKRKRGVHAQTLMANVRALLEEGVDVPQDLFGVYRQRQAKIKVK